jgi:hypothetical protein
MDDELYVALDAKVTTTSSNNPTIAPLIALASLQYLRAETVPTGQSAQCPLRVISGQTIDGEICRYAPITDIRWHRHVGIWPPNPRLAMPTVGRVYLACASF